MVSPLGLGLVMEERPPELSCIHVCMPETCNDHYIILNTNQEKRTPYPVYHTQSTLLSLGSSQVSMLHAKKMNHAGMDLWTRVSNPCSVSLSRL